MTPDFDKIQAGMTSGLQKTTKANKKEDNNSNSQAGQGLSFKSIERKDMGTGVAGRSSVRMDNFDTDMSKLEKNYQFAQATNDYIDELVRQGYSLEEATMAVYKELGVD